MINFALVQKEIEKGRLWKARDRLLGLFSTYPTSTDVLELLGEVFYKMGDMPQAGRYWYLTECSDEMAVVALRAFVERCGNDPCVMLRQLPIRQHLDKYGPIVFKRLQELVCKCPDGKHNKLKLYIPEKELEEVRLPSKWFIWRERIFELLGLVFLIGPWLVGFFTLVIWLTSLIAPPLGKYILTHWFDLLDLVKEK